VEFKKQNKQAKENKRERKTKKQTQNELMITRGEPNEGMGETGDGD